MKCENCENWGRWKDENNKYVHGCINAHSGKWGEETKPTDGCKDAGKKRAKLELI